jgi:hypothetical protein
MIGWFGLGETWQKVSCRPQLDGECSIIQDKPRSEYLGQDNKACGMQYTLIISHMLYSRSMRQYAFSILIWELKTRWRLSRLYTICIADGGEGISDQSPLTTHNVSVCRLTNKVGVSDPACWMSGGQSHATNESYATTWGLCRHICDICRGKRRVFTDNGRHLNITNAVQQGIHLSGLCIVRWLLRSAYCCLPNWD